MRFTLSPSPIVILTLINFLLIKKKIFHNLYCFQNYFFMTSYMWLLKKKKKNNYIFFYLQFQEHLCNFIKHGRNTNAIKLKKNLLWHSHNFLLPYITVEEYFLISITFILNLYFLSFVADELPASIIIVYKSWTSFPYFAWVRLHLSNFYQ